MRIYITFGDKKFSKARDFSVRMAKIMGGFDKIIAYSPSDIDINFKKEYSDIFSIQRGCGLWLWKPYFVYKTLLEVCQDDDYLFYGDAGSFFIRNVKYIEKSMDADDIWVSCIPLREWQFTKADTFDLMSCRGAQYEKTSQAQATFLYIRRTAETIQFVKEWLDLCCDIRLLHPQNIYSHKDNPSGFYAHREDQSILSLLCKKQGIRLHDDPSQHGKYPEKYWLPGFERVNKKRSDNYPVCIVLHRTGNRSWMTIIRQLILVAVPRWLGIRLITHPSS